MRETDRQTDRDRETERETERELQGDRNRKNENKDVETPLRVTAVGGISAWVKSPHKNHS